MTDLVTILGPIGSGKSTLAELLAERVREAGLAVASVDVDDVLAMLSAPLEQFAESWERVRRVHGSLVGAWVRSGIDVVIAHGPIFTPAETESSLPSPGNEFGAFTGVWSAPGSDPELTS
jgi:adenylylsulfate kinase-like enzyme